MPKLDSPSAPESESISTPATQKKWLGEDIYTPDRTITELGHRAADLVRRYPLESTLAATVTGVVGALLLSHRFSAPAVNSEIGSFIKSNGGLFSKEEARVLRSIDWKTEARLPNLVDRRDAAAETMIIGKLEDIGRHKFAPGEFALRWPEDKYTALSKAQNLSALDHWINRGGRIVDISPAQTQPGFLQGERTFIRYTNKLKPGQYLHRESGSSHPPSLWNAGNFRPESMPL